MRFLGRLSFLLVFFSLAGGHWAVLHIPSWTHAIQEYSGSLVGAVLAIATSEDPCHVCEDAADHHEEERRTATGRADKKSDLFVFVTPLLPYDASFRSALFPPARLFLLPLRNDEPAHPVPRLA